MYQNSLEEEKSAKALTFEDLKYVRENRVTLAVDALVPKINELLVCATLHLGKGEDNFSLTVSQDTATRFLKNGGEKYLPVVDSEWNDVRSALMKKYEHLKVVSTWDGFRVSINF